MNGREYGGERDSLEEDVEIVDLDRGARREASSQKMPRTQRSPLRPRFTPQQRKTQLTVTASVVVVSLLVLVGSYAPARDVVLNGGKPHMVSPTATPAITLVYFDGNPYWGRLVVDGNVMTQLARAAGYIALPLTPGRHVLSLQADPFQFSNCTLSMPPNKRTDTCMVNLMEQAAGLESWLLRFPLSLTEVPQARREALIAATQLALNTQMSPEVVQPGEMYAVNQSKRVETARQMLKASLHLQLDTQASANAMCTTVFSPVDSSCSMNSQDCHEFCLAEDLFRSTQEATVQGWHVLGVARPSWDYMTADGKSVASGQPATDATTVYERLVPLRIKWENAHWSVTPLFTDSGVPKRLKPQFDPVCSSAMNEVQVNSSLSYIQRSHLGVTWNYVSGDRDTAGCLGIVTLNETTTGKAPVASCLYRFGTFVAINDVAQQYWPNMPLADDYERGIAQELMKHYEEAV